VRVTGGKVRVCCRYYPAPAQLVHDFPEARYMNGRKNFPCNLNPRLTADMCMHTRSTPCSVKSACEYERHKRLTLLHPIQILNYRYLLVEGNYVGGFSNYPLLVLDEADLLESRLTQFIKLSISKHKLELLHLSRLGSRVPPPKRA